MASQNINVPGNNRSYISNIIPLAPPAPASYQAQVTVSADADIVGAELEDTVYLNANVREFTVATAAGNDSLLFNGQLFNSSISAGGDSDTIVAGYLSPISAPNYTPTSTAIFNSTIGSGVGNDSVTLRGSVVQTTVDAAAGDDTVVLAAGDSAQFLANSSLLSGAGRDSIVLSGLVQNSTVMANGDNDTVVISGNDSLSLSGVVDSSVAGGIGDDSMVIDVDLIRNSTIDGQQGNDTMTVVADSILGSRILDALGTEEINRVSIKAAVIDTTFVRTQGQSDIIAVQGVDPNTFSNNTVSSAAGNDTLTFASLFFTNSSINAGSGNDSVVIGGANVTTVISSTVSASNGNDTVLITGPLLSSSVDGESGDDSINIQTANPDGSIVNSTIEGLTGNDVVNIDAGQVVFSTIGGNNGNDTLNVDINNAVANTTINAGAADDLINLTVSGGAVSDSSVLGEGGSDTVNIFTSTGLLNSSVDSGALNDTITIDSDVFGSTINGGSLNDSISIDGNVYNSTVSGGNTALASDTVKINGDIIFGSLITTQNGGLGNLIGLNTALSIGNTTVTSDGGNDTIAIALSPNSTVPGGTSIFGSSVNAGQGDNTVSIIGNTNQLEILNSSLSAGAGNDSVLIQANALINVNANLGDGSNQLFANFLNGVNPEITNSTLTTGIGADSIRIDASRANQGLVISNSTIDAGAGGAADTVNVTARDVLNSAVVLGDGDNQATLSSALIDNSTVSAGSGNDQIALPELGILRNSSVVTNAGNDTVTVNATVDPTQVALIINSTIDTGANNDSVTLFQSDVVGSRIAAGEGDNVVAINNTAADEVLRLGDLNLINSAITTGAGVDQIAGRFELISSATVSSTAGDDSVNFRSLTNIAGMTVTSGSGNDTVVLVADDTNVNSTISAVLVDTGSERDSIWIQAGNGLLTGEDAILNSTVTSGSQDDTVVLTGRTIFGSSVVSGSENDSILILTGSTSLSNSTVNAGQGADTIVVTGSVVNSSITGGSLAEEEFSQFTDDSIRISNGAITNSTIGGSARGDDTITATDKISSITSSLFQVQEGNNLFDLSTQGTVTNSTVRAGSGVDTVRVDGGVINGLNIVTNGYSDTVDVSAVTATNLQVIADNATAPSTIGDDSVRVNVGSLTNATVETYWGTDTVILFAVNDIANATVNSGSDNDAVDVSASTIYNSSLDGGAGNDTVVADALISITNSTISGGLGSDDSLVVLSQTIGNSSIAGLDGNDTILVGDGTVGSLSPSNLLINSTVAAGTGNDSVIVNAVTQERVLIALGDGNDTATVVDSPFANSTLLAEAGADLVTLLITTLGGNSSVDAGTGNDTLDLDGVLNLVNSTVTAGADEDVVWIGTINSTAVGAQSSDLLGGAGNDTLRVDPFVTMPGAQTADLVGARVSEFEYYSLGAGNTLRVNAEAIATQTLSGLGSTFYVKASNSAGTDANVDLSGMLLSGWNPAGRITIDGAAATTDLILNGNIGTSSGFESLAAISIVGGAGDDTITGGTGNDTIVAGAGDDTIWSNTGDDSILGGLGNDTILGVAGDDSINGEAGNDSILGGFGNDTILGFGDNDDLFGNEGIDSILGGSGNDIIDGGAESDGLFGEAGNDSILGDAGDDYLDGGANNDTLLGGIGNDTLIGGTEADSLIGGAGNDTIAWRAGDRVNATGFVDSNQDGTYNSGDQWSFSNGVDIVTGASTVNTSELTSDIFAVGIGSDTNPPVGGASYFNLQGNTFADYRTNTASANYYIHGSYANGVFTALDSSAPSAQWTHTLVSQGFGAGTLGVFATASGVTVDQPGVNDFTTNQAANYTFLIEWGIAGTNNLQAANFISNTGF